MTLEIRDFKMDIDGYVEYSENCESGHGKARSSAVITLMSIMKTNSSLCFIEVTMNSK